MQRAAFDQAANQAGQQGEDAGTAEGRVDTDMVDAGPEPEARWQDFTLPSARISSKIQEFEATADHPDLEQRGFELAEEQKAMCKWFGAALDIAVDEERRTVPMNQRTQKA